MNFDQVVTRSCAPAKPDPTGLLKIVENWNLSVTDVLYVGDFLFDIEVGKNAGIKTALYAPHGNPLFSDQADYLFNHFQHFFKYFSFHSL